VNPRLRLVVVVLALLVVGVLVWRAWSPRAADADVLNGYVEGDDLYLSSPVAGNIGQVYVVKGQRVASGAPLFAMDPSTLAAQRAQADARLQQAGAGITAADAQAGQAVANVAAARAVETNARKDFDRFTLLQRTNPQALVAQQLDQARSTLANATAQRQAAEKAAAAARQQASSARASSAQAQASLKEAQVKLDQLAQHAPSAGRIEDVIYHTGEWAGPNQPIVSLLPDDQVKLRFFVPERTMEAYRPGRIVRFACDGCRTGLSARISYVSPRAEFTPPVIYSRNTRDKLVFLVEAVPPDAQGLAPGLPVEVQPLASSSGGKR
jgi:HlyD family secretion protein